MRVGYLELLDAEGENFLLHFLDVIGLQFQLDCLQKLALVQTGVLIDKTEVDVIQLKSVHFIGFYPGVAAQTSQ